MRSLFFLFMALVLSSPAQAKWLEASSRHFVVYSDDQEKNIRLFSEQLERFHAALTTALKLANEVPSPSNRVTVYVVRNDHQVRRLLGDSSSFTYAAYIPRAGGSLAFVPRVEAGKGELDFSMIALLHEYVHHVMLSNSSATLPVWVVEGAAEFYSTAKFLEDGSVSIGRPANHRAAELFFTENLPLADLFNPGMQKGFSPGYISFYGKSWLLMHYLSFEPARRGQLGAYLKAMNEGTPSLDAAKSAFGDFKQLEKELQKYMNRNTMMAVTITAASLQPGPVEIRELSAGEGAMMPVRLRSKRGVNRDQGLALLPEARKVAAQYPGDPEVLAALAEAEHDAGNDDLAIKAADAALAINPKLANAYIQKGYAMFAMARKAPPDAKAKAYAAARAPFLALNKIENDHPIPLFFFFLSFLERELEPNANAIAALRRASELAPFDLGLRSMLAMQAIKMDERTEAIANLKPIAYNPHGGKGAVRAQAVIEQLRSGQSMDDVIKDGLFKDEEDKTDAKDGKGSKEPKKKAS